MKNKIPIVIVFCLLSYLPTVKAVEALCLFPYVKAPQMQEIRMQGIVTGSGVPLSIGTKIAYSDGHGGCVWPGGGDFIINNDSGQYGPSIISIPVNASTLSLKVSSVPKEYLGDKIFGGSNNLEFTITPDMVGRTITQDLAFTISLTTPPPLPPPPPRLGDSTTQTVATPKTNDQICQDNFGLNVYWNGTKGNYRNLDCKCKSGYEWNGQKTGCVSEPQGVVEPQKSLDQICQDKYGTNSNWDGLKINCGCQSGYQFNQDQSSCVVAPTIAPKPKIKSEIKTESSLIKKENKSLEKTNQQNSVNSSVSDKTELGNSSSMVLNNTASSTVVENKNPEQKSIWGRIKGFFGF